MDEVIAKLRSVIPEISGRVRYGSNGTATVMVSYPGTEIGSKTLNLIEDTLWSYFPDSVTLVRISLSNYNDIWLDYLCAGEDAV